MGQQTCSTMGTILQGTTGHFSSPGFPFTYPNGIKCSWIISVPENHFVRLRFLTFDMERCLATSLCTCDKVEVRDGQSEGSSLLQRLCGDTNPPSLESTGSHMRVELETDMTRNERGFDATYLAVCKYSF